MIIQFILFEKFIVLRYIVYLYIFILLLFIYIYIYIALFSSLGDFLGKKVRFSYKQLKTGEITVVGLPSGMTTSLLTRSGNLAGVGPSDLQKILDAEDLISVQGNFLLLSCKYWTAFN